MAERNSLSRKEIDSHSTMITNERIGDIKNVVWRKGLIVMSSRPDPISANEFFSAICQWFIETPHLFKLEVNEEIGNEINKAIKRGDVLRNKLMLQGNLMLIETLELIELCLHLQYLMNTAMQNLGYYFKVSTPEPRGFDDALRIFGMEIKKSKQEIEENAEG